MSPGVDVALTTEAFGTVEARVAAAYGWGEVGGGLDLPVVLWIASGVPDTGRLAVVTTGALWDRGRIAVEGHGELRGNLQVDVLGTRFVVDAVARLDPAWVWDGWRVALRVGWEQPLATAVWVSEYTRTAFDGSGSDARDGVIGPAPGRGIVGVGVRGPIAGGWSVHAALDGVVTPWGLGMDVPEAVVVGQWPVRAEVGVRVDLP